MVVFIHAFMGIILPSPGGLTRGLERGRAPWAFYFFLSCLGLTCISLVRANEQHNGAANGQSDKRMLICTSSSSGLRLCESDCSAGNETELQYVYRSSYNHKKSRTDNFALTCNVKYLINSLNVLQFPSLTDSTWIAFCKLSGLKFKHISVLWLVLTVITRVSAMHIYVITQIGCSI